MGNALAQKTKPAARRPSGGVDLSQTLAAVPMINQAVRQETRGESLVLFVPLRERWWMTGPVSWWLPLRREKGVALDQLGTEVWRLCDGHRDLEKIIERFADQHRLGFHEARLTVMRFMRMLALRKLIVLITVAEPPESPKLVETKSDTQSPRASSFAGVSGGDA